MFSKTQKRGLTLVELLVVILIIAILIAVSSTQYDKVLNNNKIQNVEDDLAGWMSDINQYIEDYGPFKVREDDLKETTDELLDEGMLRDRYFKYLKYGNIKTTESDESSSLNDFSSNSPLNILQSYCTNAFTVIEPEVNEWSWKTQHVILTTKSKKDPWGQKYKIICDTESGSIIVLSTGLDAYIGETGDFSDYENGKFGDDIILVVNPKE